MTNSRDLLRDLRRLAARRAPAGLAEAILASVGLADSYAVVDCALGPVHVAWGEHGITAVSRAADDALFERAYRERYGHAVARADDGHPMARAAQRAADGERVRLRFDLDHLSEFERAVLLKALEIPRGEVRPYGWIAREIGRPAAVRAVGTALRKNPIPLLIPCHRVVRTDGSLGQYAMGGPEAKRTLLDAEAANVDELTTLAEAGIRYIGSDTTHVYCYPTCHHARRITPAHRRMFASEAAAATAGYHPCKSCRPSLSA
ncbi:MAG TPA: methylated-DNA--[protein]-cysteine S-methyltransferase [Ktedonobacterales bacterium]